MRADSKHTGSCQGESSEPPEADGASVRAGHKLRGSTLEGTNYHECTGWLLSGRACGTN